MGEVLLFTDATTHVDADAVARIVENFDETRDVALVNPETTGGKNTPTTGPITGGGR